jgi:hypothetical protein
MKQVFYVLLVILFFSCENASIQQAANYKMKDNHADYESTDSSSNNFQQSKKGQNTDKGVQTSKIDWNKKIVKTAFLNAEVKDYKAFSSTIYQKAKQFGGYVSNESQNSSEHKIENTKKELHLRM